MLSGLASIFTLVFLSVSVPVNLCYLHFGLFSWIPVKQRCVESDPWCIIVIQSRALYGTVFLIPLLPAPAGFPTITACSV